MCPESVAMRRPVSWLHNRTAEPSALTTLLSSSCSAVVLAKPSDKGTGTPSSHRAARSSLRRHIRRTVAPFHPASGAVPNRRQYVWRHGSSLDARPRR